MSRLRWLIREIHRRSLWQVALTYLGLSWIVLQVAGHVVDRFALADWTYGAVVLVLLVGLPVVIATAIVQEGPPGSDAAADHARQHPGDDELFRWRNAIFGGIAAGLLVVLAGGGWYAISRWGGTGEGDATGDVANVAVRERTLADAGEPHGGADRADRDGDGDVAGAAAPPEVHGAATGGDDTTPLSEPAVRFAPADPSVTARGDSTARPIRAPGEDPTERETDRAGERAYDRSAYRAAVQETDSARARAMLADASARAPDRWEEADSLYRAGLATAAEGSYPAAERDLVLARLAYEDARSLALRIARTEETGAVEGPDEPSEEAAGGGDAPGKADSIPEPLAVVESVLGRLEAALEAEDRAALRRVWVTADADQVENFALFFREARELDVGYEVDRSTLRATPGRIEVETRTTWTFRDSDGQRRIQGPFRQHLVLERRGEAWVVVAY